MNRLDAVETIGPRLLRITALACVAALAGAGCIFVKDDGRDPRFRPPPPVAPPPGVDAGGGNDGGQDVDSGNDELSSTGIPVGGADSLPSMDEMLASNPVLETTTLTSTGTGDMVTLADGFRMDVPAGALPVGATITVVSHAVEGTAEGGGTRIYRFDASTQPTAPVSIAFPIPGPVDSAIASDVYVVWFHDDSDDAAEPELDHGVLDVAAGVVRVETTRFSSAVVQQDSTAGADVGTDSYIVAPWYSQGQTLNCWSVSFAMLLSAYGQTPTSQVEPWDPNALFRISTQDGISFSKFMWSDETVAFVRRTVPGAVVRRTWMHIENADDYTQLSRFVRGILARGSPIMVGFPNHMVVYVGASDLDFIVNDPSEAPAFVVSPTEILRAATPWRHANLVSLLWIDAPAPQAPAAPVWRTSLTVQHPSDGTTIGVRAASHIGTSRVQDPATLSGFSWYRNDLGGPGWTQFTSGTPGGGTIDQYLYPTVTVGNVSAQSGEPQRIDVGFTVRTSTGEIRHTQMPRSVMIAPGAESTVELFPPGGLIISSLVSEPGVYQIVFSTSYQGVEEDTATVPFPVHAAPSGCTLPMPRSWSGTLSGSTDGGDFSFTSPAVEMNAALSESPAGDPFPLFDFYVVRIVDGPFGSTTENGDLFIYGDLPSRPIGGMTYDIPLPRESTTFPDWYFQTPQFRCTVGGELLDFGEMHAPDGTFRPTEIVTGNMRLSFSPDCSTMTFETTLSGMRTEGTRCEYTARFEGTAVP